MGAAKKASQEWSLLYWGEVNTINHPKQKHLQTLQKIIYKI